MSSRTREVSGAIPVRVMDTSGPMSGSTAAWDATSVPADLRHGGIVNGADIGLLLGEWID